jgi:hypothetical protein
MLDLPGRGLLICFDRAQIANRKSQIANTIQNLKSKMVRLRGRPAESWAACRSRR